MLCFPGPTPEELIEIQRIEAEKQVLRKKLYCSFLKLGRKM